MFLPSDITMASHRAGWVLPSDAAMGSHRARLPAWFERLLAACCGCPQARALTDFMLPMLEFLPEKRATAAEMLQHPWLRGDVDQEEARQDTAGGVLGGRPLVVRID